MESSWTDKNAILRDLSVAQGREVPVEIKDTVSKDEKPPAVNHVEETENEFFENCVPNGDFSTGPDIPLIQQMLHLVRDYNVSDVCKGNDDESALEIGKINHDGSGDGSHPSQSTIKPMENEKKTKRRRNVAVDSLIEAYGESSCSHNSTEKALESKQPILLKPLDIMSETQRNIKECLTPLDNQKEKTIPAVISPLFMFKKKSPSRKNTEVVQKQSSKSGISSPLNTQPVSFVPSSQAAEYYKKYVERSELQERVEEDIWTKAEKNMKDIENRRKHKNMLPSSSSSLGNNGDELHGMDIKDASKRHSVSEECIVSEGLCEEKK